MYSFLGLFFLMFCSVDSFKFTNGVTKPLGYFDPLGFAKNKPPSELVKLREAELHILSFETPKLLKYK